MSVTCLIVDDDPEILNYVATHLQHKGYQAVTVASGEAALEYLEKHTIDIAIVDVMMDGMDGFELCETLKYDYEYPVIMLTARDALSDKERAFLAGTDDYVTKPFEVAELIFRIQAVLRRYQI
ncbi:response regulator transcription factor, partial [Staphylococcus pseudintermedius]